MMDAERLYGAIVGVVDGLKLMSDSRPDTKIGGAASTFNSLLKEAKKVLAHSSLIQEMTELTDQDLFVAYVSRLRVLQAEVAAIAFPS